MSHKIESTVAARRENGLPVITNLKLLQETCRVLELPKPEFVRDYAIGMAGTSRGSNRATGWMVRLPGWTIPCVFNLYEGSIYFDNFPTYDENHVDVKSGKRRAGEGGRWGDFEEMIKFEQEYLQQAIQLGREIWEEEMALNGGMVQVESDTEDELVLLCSQ